MNSDKKPETTDQPEEQPVAYDVHGQPLYSRPEHEATSQTVNVVRPLTPGKMVVTPEIKAKHDASAALYPFLNLSEHEYVILTVRRHLIGLVIPFTLGVILVAIALSLLLNYDLVISRLKLTGALANFSIMMWPILLFIFLVAAGTYIAYYVYSNNRFFLTNESVIQEIQFSLFAHQEQTVSLGSIEDASFKQIGVVQEMLNYGSIRLSTIGDEDTYRFNMVSHPKDKIALLNNAVEAFKNGRSVEDEIA